MASRQPQFFVHQDGSKTAYEIVGNDTTGAEPLVLVIGLSLIRGDWEPLLSKLSEDRQVLVFDNRGMGDSTFSPSGDEDLTIELMARDLLDLLIFLDWKTISICGYSMGGLIAQQLLLLPYIDNNPVSLPFRVTHIILAATLTGPKNKEQGFKPAPPPSADKERTWEERRELRRPMLEASLDPKWVANPGNAARFNALLDRVSSGRYSPTISEIAGSKLEKYYPKLGKDGKVLVIHGKLDNIVPFSYSSDVLQHIPWARMVEVGYGPGQLESLDFGHHWFEYFSVDVWYRVIVQFLDEPATAIDDRARMY
ncbi:alpha/beta-hydrolase [Pholiota conissans]|uniref:Alpha/beta-hydrolase n=1 Tax=Pholiota conissans TaxID=109636 RepID=A0A9P5ZE05_9AGAR|nr:alpha/beta-hydrolase [Pholiota conissans]